MALLSLAVAATLMIAYTLVKPAMAAPLPADPARRSAMSMASLLLLLSLSTGAVFAICMGYLGYRYYVSLPAWKRRKGPPKLR